MWWKACCKVLPPWPEHLLAHGDGQHTFALASSQTYSGFCYGQGGPVTAETLLYFCDRSQTSLTASQLANASVTLLAFSPALVSASR